MSLCCWRKKKHIQKLILGYFFMNRQLGSYKDLYHTQPLAMESQNNQSVDNLHPSFIVAVKVTDPEPDSAKGFYTYLVSGTDDLGTFQIRRRYNDFFYLRQSLVKKWPGIYIPPVPQKKIAGNKDSQNIEIRKKYFDFFLKRLGKIKHLFTSPITRQFLRNKTVDMEKFYASIAAPRYNELVTEYRRAYDRVNLSNENTHQIRLNIQSFTDFLKKAEKDLNGLRVQAETIVEARAGFTQQLDNCNTTMLPEYQKNVYSEYLPQQQKKEPNLIFVNNQNVQESIRALREISGVNSFNACFDLINYEILEVKAMEEAIKIKEKYELEKKEKDEVLISKQAELTKLISGKTTLKSIFSRGSKNDQIQKLQIQIPELEKDIETLVEFNTILTIIFGNAQIPIFKRNKQTQYYRMMYEVSECEMRYLASYGGFMKGVMQAINK